ncbi:MAG: hypothetical protein K6G84_08695 [Lachnospiraceae bacterium]|nr:hypothetical protein [Lachnospiraceae bacterium]
MDIKQYKEVLNAAVRHAHEHHNYITEEKYQEFFAHLELDDDQDKLTRNYFTELKINFGEWDGTESDDLPFDEEDGSYLKFYLEELDELPQYSDEEKQKIAKAAVEDDDAEAKKKLINMHLKDVVDMAKLYVYHGMSLEDLVGEGNIGLMMAVDLLGTLDSVDELDGFIGKTVMDAMDAAIERDGVDKNGIDAILERITGIGEAAKELSEELRHDITPEDLAKETDFTIEEIDEAMRLTGNAIEGLIKPRV